ncbi:DUF2336 domain-containing protein [Rhizobium sp. SAFR-030]|uniref:DUF2336 domain-containing protein n=1 Tax=Rhizobium sp. SAFR-030 TaxID=3387277 RepID=UPI003F7FFBD9
MIVKAFLQWAETAGAADRAKAAHALVRAYLRVGPADETRQAAIHAMMHLLDDPSPLVRQALSESLGRSAAAPRGVVLALAEDQPEIACHVLTLSPILTEMDLVDLIGRSGAVSRGLIAARPGLTRGACAAIAEVGDAAEAILLLDNSSAMVARQTLCRLAERHGHHAGVRDLLLAREDLPASGRNRLVQQVTAALTNSLLVRATLSPSRIAHLTQEADKAATLAMLETALPDEMPVMVDRLRQAGRLTPAFLMHALCSGRIEFFASALTNISGLEERRVRSILATGRRHAVRALYEASGLGRDIAEVFVEATLLWREMMRRPYLSAGESICQPLIDRLARPADPFSPVSQLLDLVETMHHSEERRLARAFASDRAIAA